MFVLVSGVVLVVVSAVEVATGGVGFDVARGLEMVLPGSAGEVFTVGVVVEPPPATGLVAIGGAG